MKKGRILLASAMALLFKALLGSLPFVTPENMYAGFEFSVYFLCINEILKYCEK